MQGLRKISPVPERDSQNITKQQMSAFKHRGGSVLAPALNDSVGYDLNQSAEIDISFHLRN